jgi:hypothetical protein
MPRYLQAHCRYIIYGESRAFHCDCLTAARVFQYSILSIKDSTPQALVAAKVYYSSIDFAFKLCNEFAAAERDNAELSKALEHASKLLELIVAHNALLKSSDLQPAWPRHEALLRFDLPLQRLTTHYMFTKKWFPRFFVLRGSRLYYSNGKSGHPNSLEGSLAFMRSNPAPDGLFCLDLKGRARCTTAAFYCASQTLLDAGCSVASCSAAVDGQAFVFEIKFSADRPDHKAVYLAAADDVTRQRCVSIIEAASASSSLLDIASSAALTPSLLTMRSVRAVNAVLAALGRPAVVGLDVPSLKTAGFSFYAAEAKAAGCNPASAEAAGYDVPSLVVAYGYDAVAAAGVDVIFFKAFKGREKDLSSCILVSFLLCNCTQTRARTDFSPPPPTHSPVSPVHFLTAQRFHYVHYSSLSQS